MIVMVVFIKIIYLYKLQQLTVMVIVIMFISVMEIFKLTDVLKQLS